MAKCRIRCERERRPSQVVCSDCWGKLPERLSMGWVAAQTVLAKRIAAREIYEHLAQSEEEVRGG